jgi:uncharacterized protein (TIGR03000 family)
MQDILRRLLSPALLAAFALSDAAAWADGGKPADAPRESANPADGQAKAEITILVPPDAEVLFDGRPTKLKGAERLFISPPLPVGKKSSYSVLARWKEGDKTVEQTREVEVTGGAEVRVDFLKPLPANTNKRDEVGKSVGLPDRLFRREGGPKSPWQPVGDKKAVYADDLLIGLPGDEIETADGSVRLRLLKYFNSPLPVMEPAATLHQTAGFDLGFTLERGIVEFWNTKPKGAARVQISARGETWEVVLEEPGSRLLVEFYSAWPKGARFTLKPGPKDAPLARMTFLVLKGEVDLKHAGKQLAMSAPPGLAVIEWDSATGMDDSPRRLEAPPAWVLPPTDDAGKAFAKKVEDVVGRFADEVKKSGSLDAAIDKFLASDNPLDRRLAVVALAATDQLSRLGKALRQSKQADVWENAVLAMRHWIGRGPGQDQTLYHGMIDSKNFTPREAETALQLLHDFSDDDLARPAVYEYLIGRLGSDQLFVRGLAYWHLSRLVPEGKKFGYDPFGPQDARDAAVKKWQDFIPAGKLSPAPKEEGK